MLIRHRLDAEAAEGGAALDVRYDQKQEHVSSSKIKMGHVAVAMEYTYSYMYVLDYLVYVSYHHSTREQQYILSILSIERDAFVCSPYILQCKIG
jgi:hypothetical protein